VTSRVLGCFAAATVITLSVGACGTKVITGKGQPAPAASGSSSGASTSAAPTPAPSLSPQVKLLRGKLREAHRLAGYVVRPDTSYAPFSDTCQPLGTFYTVEALSAFGGVFPDNATPIMTAGGYVTGYVQCRQLGGNESLITAAFVMKDGPSCNSTVKKLATSLRDKGARLSGYGGNANSYTVEMINAVDLNDKTKRTNTVQRLVCVGSVLAYVWSRSPVLKDARERDARLMLIQLGQAREFQVTPADKLPDLDDDPAGLRPKRADLPGDFGPETGGYDLRSYLAMAEDVKYENDLLRRDGLTEYYSVGATHKEGDLFVFRGVGLYQVTDSAAAADVVTQFTNLDKRVHQGIKILTVDGAPPGAFCFGYGDKYGYVNQRCFFARNSIAVQIDVANATRKYEDVTELAKLVKAQYDKLG
jgi:hypothetical protein